MNRFRKLERELIQEELQRRTKKQVGYCPHTPYPKQAEFLSLQNREAFYGGAAGGGKSDALLMAALQYVHVPGYNALLLRRTYKELSLPDAIMDRSHAWLQGTDAAWDGGEKRWTFPSGAKITFGYLDAANDKYRYQGSAYHYVGFDEVTNFPKEPYIWLHSRVRKVHDVKVPLRTRCAGNPGGIGHDWVYKRFVSGNFVDEKGRTPAFVPATLADNPYLDQESYRESLALLDPVTRRQLEHGVWVRDSGGLVYRFSEEVNLVAEVPSLSNYILGIDYGFNDSTAFCILGWREHDKTVYVTRCWKQSGLTPSAAAEIAHGLERQYRFNAIVGDTGGLGKGYAEEARARFNLPIQPADKNNKRGYIDLLNGDLSEGRLRIQSLQSELLKELLELPWNKERTKPEEGFEDHCCDALLYGWRACRAFLAEPEPEQVKEEDKIAQRLEERYIKKNSGDWWTQYE